MKEEPRIQGAAGAEDPDVVGHIKGADDPMVQIVMWLDEQIDEIREKHNKDGASEYSMGVLDGLTIVRRAFVPQSTRD